MAEGSPEQVLASESDWVRQFLRGLPDGPVHFHDPASALAQDFPGIGHV
jgi:phospholipid/cholesterol/gamma-HCH transport system ATP-binding protein